MMFATCNQLDIFVSYHVSTCTLVHTWRKSCDQFSSWMRDSSHRKPGELEASCRSWELRLWLAPPGGEGSASWHLISVVPKRSFSSARSEGMVKVSEDGIEPKAGNKFNKYYHSPRWSYRALYRTKGSNWSGFRLMHWVSLISGTYEPTHADHAQSCH